MKWTKDEIEELIYAAESNWDTCPPDWETVADRVNCLSAQNNCRTAIAARAKYYRRLKNG